MLYCTLPGVSPLQAFPPRIWNHQHPHLACPHPIHLSHGGMSPKTFVEMGAVVTWVVLVPLVSVGAISKPGREGKVDCEAGFVAIANNCYNFPQEPRTWTAAQGACRAQGAELASVLNHQQYTGLLQHINANYRGTYWTSGAVVSGRWTWTVTGQPMAVEWWGVPPISPKHNQCAYFCSDTLKYWPRSCNTNFRYICETPPRSLQEKEDDSSVEDPDDSQDIPEVPEDPNDSQDPGIPEVPEVPDDSQDPGIPEVPENPDDSQDPGIPDIVEERSNNSYEEVDNGLVGEVPAKDVSLKYSVLSSSSNLCAASICLLSMPLLLLPWFITH